MAPETYHHQSCVPNKSENKKNIWFCFGQKGAALKIRTYSKCKWSPVTAAISAFNHVVLYVILNSDSLDMTLISNAQGFAESKVLNILFKNI